MDKMRYILFICHENSARSQMAEGFFNHLNKNPAYVSLSAGLKKGIIPHIIRNMGRI